MRLFSAAFAVVALAAVVVAVPGTFSLSRFLFGDNGWAVRVDGLLDDGLVPTRDFAYPYGLLTLLLNRSAIAVFGATPAVTGALVLSCGILLAVGVWRLARALNLGVGPRILLVLLAPLVVNPGQMPSPAHALEPALLIHALAAQARGKLAQALLFATLGVLVKPGIGYFLGLLLFVETLATSPRRVRSLLPAAGIGLALLVVLAAEFGLDPVLKTQIPTQAGAEYSYHNYGFFHGDGRHFWHPEPGTEVAYFTTSPAGAWVVASVLLLFGGSVALPRWRTDSAARTVVAMAVLHALFVGVFFGNRYSWVYYPFLPFVGAAVALDRLPRWTPGDLGKMLTPVAGAVLGLLAAAVAVLYTGMGAASVWRSETRDGSGLFAPPELHADWQRVTELAKTHRVFVLTRAGCPGAISPGVDSPRSWYLSRPLAVPGELDRVRKQIEACECLIVPDWHDHDLTTWPEFADAVKSFTKAEQHGAFAVYRRAGLSGR